MSNLNTSISALAERLKTHSETIQTEEAIKTSAVLPFLQCLGYDVFNPGEVVPEFTADVIGKKGEKVDYAVCIGGKVQVLIECKGLSTVLNEKHLGQLYRYFSVTTTRIAILTNGREYRFYSDLDEPNKLDRRPFFVFDLFDFSPTQLDELNRFTRSDFNVDDLLAQAQRLKNVQAVKRLLATWFEDPPDQFTRMIAAEVFDQRMNAQVRESTRHALKAAFREMLRDEVRTRFASAFEEQSESDVKVEDADEEKDVVTTEEEVEGFLTIKAILRDTVDVRRVAIRDAKSYCAILLDNNNRRPLARLHFNTPRKMISLFDGEKEDRIVLQDLSDLFSFKERLVNTVAKYVKRPTETGQDQQA